MYVCMGKVYNCWVFHFLLPDFTYVAFNVNVYHLIELFNLTKFGRGES